ncbi:hypothetical protein [Scytonema sp. NUACC26]|uniref:hypothetical protein n=1 Tax=Scytonema sp. NUACC26 TaxID=3140176 RepID=UPI0034DC1D91
MAQRANQQLPVEIIKPVSTRSVLLSLLWIAILVLLANFAAKWYLEKYTTNRGDWLIREKWELLENLKQPVDWLLLGDSSCNQGILPSILNEKLNTTSINLCTIGNMTSLGDAWMLEAYIKKFGPPRNVLIVHVPDVWSRQFQLSLLAKIPLSWGYWQQIEPQIALNLNNQLDLWVQRYLPLYSANQSLANLLMFPLDSFKLNRSFKLENDGFMIWEKPNPKNVESQKEEQINFVKSNEFNISSDNSLALNRIVTEAEKYNFDVYLANSPLYEVLYENEKFKAYFSQVQKTLNAYANRSEKIHHIQKPMTFPKEQMENADHVVYSAAKVYTNELITEIISIPKNDG